MIKVKENYDGDTFTTYLLITHYKNGEQKKDYFKTEDDARYWKSFDKAYDYDNEIDYIEGPIAVKGQWHKENGAEWWDVVKESRRRNKIQESFSNGSLEKFSPQRLMDKVMKSGHSLNTVRDYNGYTYEIYIQYASIFHYSGLDDTEQKYFADVIKIDNNDRHNQERVLITDDIESYEVVDILEDWKEKTLAGG